MLVLLVLVLVLIVIETRLRLAICKCDIVDGKAPQAIRAVHAEYWPRDPQSGLPYLAGSPECPMWIVRLCKIEFNKIMGYSATTAEYTTRAIESAFTA